MLPAALGALLALSPPAAEAAGIDTGSEWHLAALSLPDSLPKPRRTIRIAVIDDGFRLSHHALQGRIWTNPGEVAGNGRDDDGNGFIDDVHGWDVSDGDDDVSPPPDRLKDFYHGTQNAGIIARIADSLLPKGLGVEIIPVKCLSDQAGKTHLKDAYKGIDYAIRVGADIINCSWGGGPMSGEDAALLKTAEAKGILVTASAGNFSTEKAQFPAAFPSVIAVAALDRQGVKTAMSNYGAHIDISAPGERIRCPSVFSDSGYADYEGTSAAVPMVSAVLALGLLTHPDTSPAELQGMLKNAADPLDTLNPRFRGKLGAGALNAIRFLRKEPTVGSGFGDDRPLFANPQGAILFRKNGVGLMNHWFGKKVRAGSAWRIRPAGDHAGIRFTLTTSGRDGGVITLAPADSDLAGRKTTLNIDSSAVDVFVPGTGVDVHFQPAHARRAQRWALAYAAVTVDSSTLYCREKKHLDLPDGTFDDGSGSKSYAWNSDCKWLITAPVGKVVELTFADLDTEPKSDLVYAFDGAGTHARIVGVFSGPNAPPTVYSTGNRMLVWFVTNETVQGQGWTARYRFVPPTEKVSPRRRRN